MNKIISSLILLLTIIFNVFGQPGKLTNEAIKNAVIQELRLQADVPSEFIDIEVNDGIVTLSGHTGNLLAKGQAVKTVKAVKGVKGVINQITISTPLRSDKLIERDIRTALLQNAATDLFEIEVEVEDGIAVLSGIVDSWQEKKLTEHVVKGIKGITAIENEISISYQQERPDYDIKKDIEGLLANNMRIQSKNINVMVEDGNVVLTGEVASASEKANVEILSWVAGVKKVNVDNLKVDAWLEDQSIKNLSGYNRSDEEMEVAVQKVFLQDPRLNVFNIDVEVENGMAILKGEVDNLQSRFAAQQNASNVIGVYTVKNHITVKPVKVPNDNALERRVRASLRKDPYLDEFDINVSADDGYVYLTGFVNNYFEKYHAKNIVSSLNGVVLVDNEVIVQGNIKTGNIEYPFTPEWYNTYPLPYLQFPDDEGYQLDWEVLQNIENQLWWSPYVNEHEIEVKVEDGIAVLRGTVDTWQEKQEATKNALQGGAEEVVNNLEVRRKPHLNK